LIDTCGDAGDAFGNDVCVVCLPAPVG